MSTRPVRTRRGVATSEFWAAAAVAIGATAAAFADALPPRYAAIASAVSVAAYAISRGMAKRGTVPGP